MPNDTPAQDRCEALATASRHEPHCHHAAALELRRQYRQAIESRKAAREEWMVKLRLVPEHEA